MTIRLITIVVLSLPFCFEVLLLVIVLPLVSMAHRSRNTWNGVCVWGGGGGGVDTSTSFAQEWI